MEIRDLLKSEIDVDVCDTVYDEMFHAYCGPIVLTEYGTNIFDHILDLEVTIVDSLAVVNIDDYNDDEQVDLHNELAEFFAVLAGYCSEEYYSQVVDENATYAIWKE